MSEPITSTPVLVTGATGFVATHIVEQLLAKGYSVRGTVRNPAKARQGHLSKRPGADNLELVQADLMDPESFNDTVAGCEYVMHTASPYVVTVKDPQRDLVDPAVKGTLAVLEACAAAGSVKRAVVTSSMAAMIDQPDGRVLTEDDWNTKSTLKRNPYYLSKTMAEKAAWDFVDKHPDGFDLVVINPSMVLGPEHSDRINTSNQILVDWTTMKSPMILALDAPVVDVRDVAAAHIAAMENPDVSGRYLCAAAVRSWREMIEFIRSEFPEMRMPRISADGTLGTQVAKVLAVMQPAGVRSYLQTNLGRKFQIDNSKIRRELGIEFRPVEDTLRDTYADLIASQKVKVTSTRAG